MGRFLTLSAFFVLAVAVIAATIPSFIDWEKYREPIERAASASTGRDVKITGSVGFTILPFPSVELGGVTVANRAGGVSPNLLTLETLSAKLALAPLLRGALKIETFQIQGADLKLERGEGHVNWTFSHRAEDGGSTSGGIEALLIKAIRDISIEDFSASDLKISYSDTVSHQTFDWEIKHGKASLVSMNGPFQAEGRVLLGGEAFYVIGKVGINRAGGPRPIFIDALSADGLAVKFDGTMDRSSGNAVMQGRTAITAPAAHQLGTPFAAVTGSRRGAWAGATTLNLPASIVGHMALSAGSIKGSELEIEIGSATGLGTLDIFIGQEVTGSMKIESKALDLDELIAAVKAGKRQGDGSGLDVDIEIAVETRAATLRQTNLEGASFSVRLLKTGPVLGSFRAQLPGQTKAVYAFKSAGSGRSGDTQRGTLELDTNDARTFLTWIGIDLDGSRARAFRTFNLKGDVILGPEAIKLTGLEATLDGVKIEGALVRTRSERASLGANLKVLGLDLTRFGTGNKVEDWLKYMSAFDINAILKLRQFSGFGLERRSADVKAQMVRGTLTLEDVQVYGMPNLRVRGKLAKDAEGALAGKIRLDARDLALCSAVQERSGLNLPGCADDSQFTVTATFDVAGGKASGPVVASSAGLTFEGTLGGAETMFAEALGLTFDGKGEVGTVIYQIAGTAGESAGAIDVKVALKAEAPKLETMVATFAAMQPWSKPFLGLVETRGETVFSADLEISPQITRIENLSLGFGPAMLTGSGEISRAGGSDAFDLNLHGENLKLLKTHGAKAWSTEELALNIPKDATGDLSMTLANTDLGGVPLSAATFKATVKSGGVDLNIKDALAFDGNWEGDVTLREGKGGLVLSAGGKARDLDLKALLEASLGSTGMTGKGDLTLSVSSSGSSWKSLAENSAGMLDLKAWDGSLSGFDLLDFSAGLKEASGELGARLAVEGALSSGITRFTKLETEMTLADGKLRAISLSGDLDGGTLSGEGEINLAELTWKGRTAITLDDHQDLPKIQSAVSGTLGKPRLVWDTEELVLKFAEAWLLANRTTQVPDLPGADGSGVSSEELGDLAPATE